MEFVYVAAAIWSNENHIFDADSADRTAVKPRLYCKNISNQKRWAAGG
jgi:hypothetical protein